MGGLGQPATPSPSRLSPGTWQIICKVSAEILEDNVTGEIFEV